MSPARLGEDSGR